MAISRAKAYWLCQGIGWGGHALISISIVQLTVGFPWWKAIAFVSAAVVGIAVTHGFRAYIRRYGWVNYSLGRLVPRVLGASVVLSILISAIETGLYFAGLIPLIGDPASVWTAERLFTSLFGGSVLIFGWALIYFGLHFFWNYRQSEIDRLKLAVQSRDAKLDALKLQLNPHFLFNSLNSVRALVTEDPEQAKQMVTRLARLLRTTLKSSKRLTVPLYEEMALVRTYLALEAVRLEERLSYQIETAPGLLEVPVPPLMVQTLVENAVKHGIAARPDGGTIRVTAAAAPDHRLHVRVTNTGQLADGPRSDAGGVGLQNVRERLHLLFGNAATLTLQMDGPQTVVAEARLPRRPPEQPEAEAPSAARSGARMAPAARPTA